MKEHIMSVLQEISAEEDIALDDAKYKWEELVENLTGNLQQMDDSLRKNVNIMSEQEQKNRQADIEGSNLRLSNLKHCKKRYVQQIAAKSMNNWKSKLLSQKGKGLGNYRIDRGAEQAVFHALQEQLMAHER